MSQDFDWVYPKWSEPDMRLPVGKTCGDCAHLARCVAMFGAVAGSLVCDFSPSKFMPKVAAEKERTK